MNALKCPVATSTDDQVPLIIYLDFKSPYAYLAVEPTRKMLAEVGVVADWRPFVLDIPSYLGSAKLGKGGKVAEQNRSKEQWSGVKYAYFDCRRYANLKNMTVRGTVKIWNTDLPAVGWWWVKQQESLQQQCAPKSLMEKYIDAVYSPFWRREFDAEDIDSVERVLADVGANIDGFKDYAAGPGLQANAQFQSDAFESGIYGVPTYVLANKVLPNQGLPDEVLPSEDKGVPQKFFGREHLPLIRWYLQGQVGGRPDVAYEVGDDAQILADPELPTDSILPVYIDVKAPQSYLALAGTLAMAAKENIALDWRFFHGQPLRNPGVWIEGEDRGAMHRRIRGTYFGQDIQRYAPHALADLYVTERSSAPAFGLAWVKALAAQGQDVQVGGYVEAVLLRFWQQQEDIDSLAGVESVLLHLGVTTDGFFEFVDRAGLAAVELAATQAQELGVSVSPTYFIGTEPFQGRQHLPLLAARLRP